MPASPSAPHPPRHGSDAPHPHVAWTRYWVRASAVPQTTPDGFLVDPFDHPDGRPPVRVANHDARSFADIASAPCLVLLGEPGAGKTTEIQRLATPDAVYVNLGAPDGEPGGLASLEQSKALAAWKATRQPLSLVIDAYDEAPLHSPTAARRLRHALVGGLPDRPDARRQRSAALRLRITSRPGVWPASLTDAFTELWGEDGVDIYTLAPLLRSDVEHAASVLGSPPGFLDAVTSAQAGSWAALPQTLFWLIALYAAEGTLPSPRAELFASACRHAIWPDALSVDDLARSLAITPRAERGGSAKHSFLENAFRDVSADQVAHAVAWVACGQIARAPDLARAAFVTAAEHVAMPSVGAVLARVFVRLAARDESLSELRPAEREARTVLARAEEEDRSVFLDTLVREAAQSDVSSVAFRLLGAVPLVRMADVPWLVARLLANPDGASQEVAGRLLRQAAVTPSAAALSAAEVALRAAADQFQLVQTILREAYDAWDLREPWVQQIQQLCGPGPALHLGLYGVHDPHQELISPRASR